MRGPKVRIQYDMRRLWKCPKCGYERRAHAHQTTLRCHCESDGPFMKLVESQRLVRPEPEELDLYFEFDGDLPSDAAQPNQEASKDSPDAAEATG